MKNLIKIKEDFISESVDKDFPIHKLADELMRRAYNQALEDQKETLIEYQKFLIKNELMGSNAYYNAELFLKSKIK